eukprot:COSAG01_NODE_24262_length_785_cov_0.588921_1_plen_212_part_10
MPPPCQPIAVSVLYIMTLTAAGAGAGAAAAAPAACRHGCCCLLSLPRGWRAQSLACMWGKRLYDRNVFTAPSHAHHPPMDMRTSSVQPVAATIVATAAPPLPSRAGGRCGGWHDGGGRQQRRRRCHGCSGGRGGGAAGGGAADHGQAVQRRGTIASALAGSRLLVPWGQGKRASLLGGGCLRGLVVAAEKECKSMCVCVCVVTVVEINLVSC